MPHSQRSPKDTQPLSPKRKGRRVETRYTVALLPGVVDRVKRCAETADTSMSKTIAALVRLGLDSQERRKREFFKRLKENLANDDPNQQDHLIDEFRDLILGH